MTVNVTISGWKENFPSSLETIVKANTLSEVFTKYLAENTAAIQLMQFNFVTKIVFEIKPQQQQFI